MAMAAPGMSSFSIESMVRGHHIYKDRWCPHIDEELTCQRERHSCHDPFAVSVLKSSVIVRHVPRHVSAICCVPWKTLLVYILQNGKAGFTVDF